MDKFCRLALNRLPKIVNLRPTTSIVNNYNARGGDQALACCWTNKVTVRHYVSQKPPLRPNVPGGNKVLGDNNNNDEQPLNIAEILDREIQDESAELSQHLSTDQFPGFSVEADDADVKLTKQVKGATVTVRFSVSSSLNEWPADNSHEEQQQQNSENSPEFNTTLVSMPEFQVQIQKDNHTLEMSCYFEEMEQDEETGEAYALDPVFSIDELVMYQGEPKETEFAVSAEYFQEDLQAALLQHLAEYGIDDEFSRNLVGFATSYEKKQYIGLMRRLKSFVEK